MKKEIYGKKKIRNRSVFNFPSLRRNGRMYCCSADDNWGGVVNFNMSRSLHNLHASHSDFGWMN